MIRLLLFISLIYSVSAAFVAISATDGTVVELDASAFFAFNDNRADYLSLYMPAIGECQQIIDAQLVHTDNTYRINDWFYVVVATQFDEEAGAMRESITESISVMDLDEFTRYAFQVGVWNDDPSCGEIWTRLSLLVIDKVFSQVKNPIGSPLYTTQHGLFAAFYCGEDFCTAAQLTEKLKISNNIKSLKLIK